MHAIGLHLTGILFAPKPGWLVPWKITFWNILLIKQRMRLA